MIVKELNKLLRLLQFEETLPDGLLLDDENHVQSPAGDLLPLLQRHKSSLHNTMLSKIIVEKFITCISEKSLIHNLNHIGFCYKVDSVNVEKERIIKQVSSTKLHVYQEPSNDYGLWMFIGDKSKYSIPLLELIPVENTSDPDVDYWLPHIQIDVNTSLSESEINGYIQDNFSDDVFRTPIIIEDVTYIVRIRLGAVDGINLFFDLGTNNRDIPFYREHILQEIS